MTTISDSTNFLMDPQRSVPSTYNTKGTYESALVVDAPKMNIVETRGYPEKLTFQTVFPPVCLKSHWDPSALSKYVLPQDLKIPLPVDPRPLFRNCVNYFNLTPITESTKEESVVRSKLDIPTQPGSGVRGVPYELYVKNIDKESDLFLNHPQDQCDDDKWMAERDSDLFVNRHKPVPSASDDSGLVKVTELEKPLATITPNGPYKCRADVDQSAWGRSARVFNNPTREDRMPGNAPRLSEAPLGYKGPRTARVTKTPRVWSANSVVFYVDSHSGYLNLSNLATGLRDLKYEVAIYSTETTSVKEGISYHHVSEFVPNDAYSTIVMWGGSDLLENFQYMPKAKAVLLNLDEEEDYGYVCSRANKDIVHKIIVKSAYHRSKYQCYPWSKFEVIPSALPSTIFTGPNRYTERMPHRVLVTEYSPELVLFVQHAWMRLRAEFPDAELHVWESAGDDKKTVLPTLMGITKNKGVFLHGSSDLNGMIRERFASRCHVYLEDYDQVSCEAVRLSALAGCIPIMPERGVYTELKGFNVPGSVREPSVLIEYAKTVSTLFKNPEYAHKMQINCQMDPSLKGNKATAERWASIIKGLVNESKPFSVGSFNSLFQ
jgi:hypothetical protein